MSLFDGLDRAKKALDTKSADKKITRAPFGWPGGKSKSLKHILPHLPYRDGYCTVFGGSGVDLLNRHSSKLEVFNDRHSGVTAFYKCLQDREKFDRLCDKIDLTVQSREFFANCKLEWKNELDDVERAFKWYYMVSYSFANIGRNFGRSVSCGSGTMAGKMRDKLELFPYFHERLKKVQIENLDFADCIRTYDQKGMVFYMDPPYIDAYAGTYEIEMTQDQHHELMDLIFKCKGFVAFSSYPNPYFDNMDWDNRITYEVFVSSRSITFDGNGKESMVDVDGGREHAVEALYIKEAR